MPLPVVQPEIYDGLNASKFNHDAMIRRIIDENPEIAALLVGLERRGGPTAVIGGLVVYRLLAAQADANDLKELFT